MNFEKWQVLGAHVPRCDGNPEKNNNISKIESALKNSKKKLSENARRSISSSMKIAHKEKRAWNIGKSRWNNKKSYPETFFERCILNEFDDKDYICEYPLDIYSLDFAWPHKKKAIEIDGEQHLRFEEYRIRDKRKDDKAEELGWKIVRIQWKDLFNFTKNYLELAKNFIDNK